MTNHSQDDVIQRVGDLLDRDEPVSRNRDFGLFMGRQGRAVLRLYRIVRALGRELDRAASDHGVRVALRRQGGELWLEVRDRQRSYTHHTRVPQALAPFLHPRLARLGLAAPVGESE